jgi:hypothetical protein
MAPPTPEATLEYQTFWSFTGTDGACDSQHDVFLLPPTPVEYDKASIVTAGNVYRPPSLPPPIPNNPPYGDDFTIAWTVPSQPTTANVSLSIGIKNANQWRCGASARQALQANFSQLAIALDQLEYTSQVLLPGATQLILRRIAEILPAPLRESLYYFHGLNTGILSAQACPYVDLTPGMRLVIQPEANQLYAPGSSLNGLVGGGSVELPLCGVTGSDGFRRIAFDPFLGAIAAPQIANVPQPGPQVVAGGVLDLQAAGLARRWYRLLYPPSLPSSASGGDVQLSDSVTLVGAETRADLELATANFQAGKPATGVAAPLVYTVLRGRAAIVPQVAFLLNGQPAYAELGTTFRQLVEPTLPSNPLEWGGGQAGSMTRLLTPQPKGLPQAKSVMFTPRNLSSTQDPRAFDLPVVQGDAVQVKYVR